MLQMRIFPELPRKDLTAIENTHTMGNISKLPSKLFIRSKASIKTNNSL